MPRRDALVPEIAIDLIHAFEPADDEPLQIKLRRDPQIKIDIERIVMGHEGLRRGAAVERLHHRRFHLDVIPFFELTAQRCDDLRALQEYLAALRIRNQIQIALAVPDLHVFQTMPLLRHGEERLRKEFERFHMQAQLARARAEKVTLRADNVPDIEQTEQLVIPLTGPLYGASASPTPSFRT